MGGIRKFSKSKYAKQKQAIRAAKNGEAPVDDRDKPDNFHNLGKGYKDIIRENEHFEKFYKAQKLVETEEEFQEMIETFKKDLPASFRVTGFRSQAVKIRNIIESQYFKDIANANEGVKAEEGQEPAEKVVPKNLEWYPDRMGWQLNLTRKNIRREEAYLKLHQFLISETESGNISRQETVSMIPPIVLDVKPEHKVLDLCAAPGSKTAQLIEAIHSADETKDLPEGIVVANDADNSRCYLLVHQAKRLQSPNVMITNHDASNFPNIQIENPEKAGETCSLKFDRILCDVPCSSDATLRKNADIWPKWNCATSCNLHGIQYRIGKRGLELLDIGGKMVYSTCSLNPVENEAVILRLLKEAGDGVELVEIGDKVPGLKYRPGLSTWVVSNKQHEIFSEFSEVPQANHTLIRPSMFPAAKDDDKNYNLQRCIRILPHLQDTGGFFVAVLRKTAPCLWENKKQYENPADVSVSEANGGEKRKNENSEKVSEEKDDEKPPPTKKQKKAQRFMGYREDPFIFFEQEAKEPNKMYTETRDFYNLRESFAQEMCMIRCKPTETSNPRSIYAVSKLIRNIINTNGEKVRVINAGVKAFVRSDNRGSPAEFRLAQEGSLTTIPFMQSRILNPSKQDLETLLLINDTENPTQISEFGEDLRAQCEQMTTGSVALVYEEKGEEGDPPLKVQLVGWKGKTSLRAYVPKHERVHYLRLIGGDTSKFEKNKFEERRQEAKIKGTEESVDKADKNGQENGADKNGGQENEKEGKNGEEVTTAGISAEETKA